MLSVMETLVSGYDLLEAPRSDSEGRVYFSDVSKGGVYRLGSDGGVDTVVAKRRGVGGIVLHADGGVVVTGRSVCHIDGDASRDVLAIDGVVFNDLCCDADGRVWVGGSRAAEGAGQSGRRSGSVYRIDPDGHFVEVCDGLGIPNGMGFSSDGTRLYVVDSAVRQIVAFAVDASGEVGERAVWADLSRGGRADFGFPPREPTPDGLAVDEAGGVWVAMLGAGSLQRFDPEGRLDVTVDVPASLVTSVAFGGHDRQDLYVTSARESDEVSGALFHTRASVAGSVQCRARL
jgi:xylono-1,5-lactonase